MASSLEAMQPTVQWLKARLWADHRITFTTLVYRPPFWYAYDHNNNFMLRIEDDLMNRAFLALPENVETPTAAERWELAASIPVSQPDRDDDWAYDDDDTGGEEA